MSMSIEKALDKIADVLTKTTDDANGSIEYSLTLIANALENGGGTGGGGAGIMVVEVGENNVINHSYEEIVEHVTNGGYAYFSLDGTIYNLSIVIPAEGATVGEIRFESNNVEIDDETVPTFVMYIEKATITSENPNNVILTSYSVTVNQE